MQESGRDQVAELKRSKAQARNLLLGAVLVFFVTLAFPPGFAVGLIRAIAEAAMVGALADWFAVAALFRHIPLPLVGGHTAIIPRHKDQIADNLATFVQEKFLDADSLVELIRRNDPAQRLAHWLSRPANAQRVGRAVLRIASGMLELVDDARIQRFLRRAAHAAIDRIDLSGSLAQILDALTSNGRHQELLDAAIGQLVRLLQQPSTRVFIAGTIVNWLKTEHPLKEKVLPTEWIGTHGSEMIADAVNKVLDQIGADPEHQLRQRFDEAVARLVDRLKHDADFARRVDDIRRYVKEDEALNRYIAGLWGNMRRWLQADIAREDSVLGGRGADAARWLGQTLSADASLREAIDGHLQDAARTLAPDFSRFLTRHIRDTVRGWEARDMAQVIELNIGKDLQRIRINGTIVGGAIGCGLYLISWGLTHWRGMVDVGF
ncbi:DUF445 domain-containing protein [Cupriavidus sp. AU9028]|uniref:DUF445 domain-containing protein n=1 Tax=Cupriavidus sp. AU9028 TaxID=2871157 RepID=UPI001C9858B3|nr:DUF445 family protein [Cupriavidus sp. AU9028]MBY4898864.1 DUF445 family protein [Cupriavidus sp. AU9028]